MDIKYKYIEHRTTFFVLLLWNRTWSELSVKIQKIIQKIPFLKLFFPVVLSIFRRTSLKQAWGALIQWGAAWVWMAVGSSSRMSTLRCLRCPLHSSEQVSSAAQEQGRELEWGSAVPSPRKTPGFAQWRPTQPCRAWQPLVFPDTFFCDAKGQWKWSVVVLCPRGWYLVSAFSSANCCY